jgi:Sulfotransferase domain
VAAVLKVFGIGLNKTGTVSLHAALEALGIRSLHWGGQDVRRKIVQAMEEGRRMVDDLPEYEAFSDITLLSENFALLDEQYPGSKFILTMRSLDNWLNSRRAHVERNVENQAQGLYDGIFLTVDYEGWTRSYHEHHARVLDYFAGRPRDLLVMDIEAGDGYEKLCPFLERPFPAEEFPWRNRKKSRM